ncbi:hypothetical protein AMTRI_Chr09g33480 [Amborella trichopoda]
MGRVKLQMKKIENTTNRQVTYSKRRSGLIKKAYELSVLCDIDIALVLFSQLGKLSVFSGKNRIEEVFARYMRHPAHERGSLESHCNFNDLTDSLKQRILEDLKKLRSKDDLAYPQSGIFEGEPVAITSQTEADHYEHMLQDVLDRVNNRKRELEKSQLGPLDPTNFNKFFHGESSNAHGFPTTDSTDWNNPQSVAEYIADSSVYSSLLNVNELRLADQVGLNNESNKLDEDEESNQNYTTSQLLETYTAATPAIHAQAISDPYTMNQVRSLIP